MTGWLIRAFTAGSKIAMGVAWGVAALLWAPRLTSAQTVGELRQDPMRGAEVFKQKGCVRCHAAAGLGGREAPDLAYVPARGSLEQLGASLWNHVPIMRREIEEHGIDFAAMDPQEAADLIGFLFTLDYFDLPGDVVVGKRLFREKKCVICHRIGDYGGEVGPDLDFVNRYGSPIMVAAAMWNHGAPMAEAMRERGIERPTFEGSELIDLISYLESLAPPPLEGRVHVLPGRPEAGRAVFIEKRCNECHSVGGVGGQIAPDLAEVQRRSSMTEFAAAMWNKAPAMLEAMRDREILVPQIGGQEMADLLAYLYAIGYLAEPGDPDLAPELIREKGCLGCHKLRGSGGSGAGDLSEVSGMESAAAVVASMWNHVVRPASGDESEEVTWPTLRPEEMADLIAFLQAVSAG